jgi:sugar lactone lactonase YvrE
VPDGIAVHPITGDVYIGGNWDHRIRKISGNVVTTFAGTGGGRRVDGPVATAEFNFPCGLAFDSVGNLYVGDVENHCIRVINTGGYVQTFAGSSTQSSIDGFANVATFNRPPHIAFDSGGNMVVIDATGNLVRMIQTPELSAMSPLGHNPLYGKFLVPMDTRTADNTVQINGFTGRYIRFRASVNIGDGFLVVGQAIINDANGTNVALGKPAYQSSTYPRVLPVACITNGTTTIKDWPQLACTGYDATNGGTRRTTEFFEIDLGAETAISSIRLFGETFNTSASTNDRVSYTRIEINTFTDSAAAMTSYAATIAAQPGLAAKATEAQALKQSLKAIALAGSTSGYADGPAGQALFNSPAGVVQDAQGNTYVCDQLNNNIRKITVSGAVSTFAGSGTAGTLDGTLATAQFNQPVGISIDSKSNNLYVNEYVGYALRKITPEGVVTSLDKTSLAMSYSSKVDSLGNIYVVDTVNHCITIPTPQPRPKGIPVGAVGTFTGTGIGVGTSGASPSLPIAAVNVTDTGVLVFMVNEGGVTKMIANDTPNTAKSYSGPISAYDPARWPTYTSAGVKTTGTYVLNLTSLIYPTIAGFISGVASTGIIPITSTNVTNSTNAAEIMSGQNLVAIGYDSAANKTVMIANDAVGTAKWYTGPISAYNPASWPSYNSAGLKTNGNYILLPVAAGNFTGTNIRGTNNTGTMPIASVNVTNSNDTALVSSGKNLVFMVFDDGYTKMVANDDVGTAKFYAGPISDYNPARWLSYANNGVKADGRYMVNLRSLTYPIVTAIPSTTYAGVKGTNGFVDGPLATAQFSYPTDMAIHPFTGDMYIADSGNHMIRVISRGLVSVYAGTGVNVDIDGPIYCPDSTPTALRFFASFNSPYGLAFDARGEALYICEQGGQSVRKINMSTGYVSTCAGTGEQGSTDGTGSQASFKWLQGIAVDRGDNIILGDKGNNRVRMIQTVATQIGSAPYLGKFIVPTASTGADNTIQVNGFVGRYVRIRPSASVGDGYLCVSQVIVIDSTGRNIALGKPVYVTATLDGAPSASMVTNGISIFPGSDTFGAAPNGSAWYSGPGRNDYLEIDLRAPVAITSIRLIQGANFTSTTTNDRTSQTRIEINTTTDAAATASYTATLSRESDEAKLQASGALVTELTLNVVTYGGDGTSDSVDGSLETAQFSNPAGIVTDSTGNIFVVDFNTNVIRKITPDGMVSTFAGSGAGETTDGTGTAAAFNSPYGMDIDSANNLYVTEIAGNALRKITPSGVVTTLEDKGFNYPYDCAVDSNGNVYVVDSYNHRITVQSPGGRTTNFAGVSGKQGYKDGPAATALFNNPSGIAVHPTTGDIYVGGGRDACVRVIKRGQVSTYAGSGSAGYVDGPRYSAQFFNPYGLTFDSQGNLYVIENINSGRVRIINTGGFVETVAGSSSPFFDGVANVAGFSFPTYMTMSKGGDIYVSDLNNNRIRMIQTPGYQKAASSAVAQTASSAAAQQASSAAAQQASSALVVAQQASSATARQASSALAVAQQASSAQASSALAVAQQASSATAQQASSALAVAQQNASSAVAQAASSAQQREASSARAQGASSADAVLASSAVAQTASSAQERSASSAVEQTASSAQQQAASSAQQQTASSAIQQQASSAQQQTASSAIQQQASSAQQQAASSAQRQAASSAVQQQASSAVAQTASSAIQQQASSAQQQAASSALVQRASSAVAQSASSAVAQTASSAQQQFASSAKLQALNLAGSISVADAVKPALSQSQSAIITAIQGGTTGLPALQGLLATLAQNRANLITSGKAILQYNPNYQDPALQTIIPDNTLSALGVTKVYDALRNSYIFLDSNKNIIANPITPSSRAYTSGAQRGGKRGSRKAGVLMYRV